MSHHPRPALRRVLIIDDNEAIHADFRKVLTPTPRSSELSAAKVALFGAAASEPAARAEFTFDLGFANQGEEGVRLAQSASVSNDPFMLAFVDMRMPPGWDGLTTIKRIWQADPRLQVVICSAYSDYSLDQIAKELGSTDKLLILKKPFDSAEVVQLANTLSEKWVAERAAQLRVEELEHIVQERTAEIEHAMLHDKLTGLPNRVFLQTRLEMCLQRQVRRPDERFALLFLDFDRFKLINDSLGHEMGDVLLIEIAERLREAMRGSDAICRVCTPSRVGGDEFVVLLEDLREERDAARVAERLLSVLAEPYELDNQTMYVTASIGIATSDRRYERASDMIRDADTAMYRAKAAGRARYVLFDRKMHDEVMNRLSLETSLRSAIQKDELTLHYQPIVRLADRAVSGFEALLRWRHPLHGLTPAAELIAVAEETGLIQAVSLRVLEMACAQLRAWQDHRVGAASQGERLMMSVNLSRKLLIDPDLVSKIARVVRESNIEPGTLILEITESTMLHDRADAVRVFSQLKELGIWLHLDDFGTGYSSLSCLFELPLSGLKIDRSFIQCVLEVPAHAIVLESIVRIARAFKLQVIAEGVETREQAQLVARMGVDHAQGYIFGRPEPAPVAEAYLHSTPQELLTLLPESCTT